MGTKAQDQTVTPTALSSDNEAIQKLKEKIELQKLQLEEAELKVKLLKAQQQLTPQLATAVPTSTNTPENITDEQKKAALDKFKTEQLKKAQELAKANKDNPNMLVLDTVNAQLWYKGIPYTAYELNRIAEDQAWKGKREVSGRNNWGMPKYLYQYKNSSLLKYDTHDRGILSFKTSDKPEDFQFLTQDGFSFAASSGDIRVNAANPFFSYKSQDEKNGQKILKYGHDGGLGFNEEIEFYFDRQDKMTMIRYGILGER
jgi:hypothetical protein